MRRYRIYRVNVPGTASDELLARRHFDYGNDAIEAAKRVRADPDDKIQVVREETGSAPMIFWRSWEET